FRPIGDVLLHGANHQPLGRDPLDQNLLPRARIAAKIIGMGLPPVVQDTADSRACVDRREPMAAKGPLQRPEAMRRLSTGHRGSGGALRSTASHPQGIRRWDVIVHNGRRGAPAPYSGVESATAEVGTTRARRRTKAREPLGISRTTGL